MKIKNSRLEAIRLILSTHEIGSQEELLKELNKEGYTLTQATLSRDLKELKIAKMPNSEGRYCYRLHRNLDVKVAKNQTVHIDGSVSLVFSQNIAVLHTKPGYASVIAANIDACEDDFGVLGTIAGDDTVMIVMGEGVEREVFAQKLGSLISDLVYSL
jgi:transcriptional regulator of arginine metabolism